MYPPVPASDDSAVESMSSGPPSNSEPAAINSAATQSLKNSTASNPNNLTNGLLNHHFPNLQDAAANLQKTSTSNHHLQRPKITRPSSRDLKVCSHELTTAALQMHRNNSCLMSRSTRTVLSCFDELEVRRFGDNATYLVNFISTGPNTNPSTLARPVSILWPDTYERLVEQVATLDAFLLNANFKEKPVAWMLDNNLTTTPHCKHCNEKMNLQYENNTVRWQCLKTQPCSHYFMPIHRPSFFYSYEKVSLDKLLFSIYFWATGTPTEELYSIMNLEAKVLDSIWRRLQNVCRILLEKKYPRLRLTDSISDNNDNSASLHQISTDNPIEPVDLISIKLNEIYVVCAKHPRSNLVRLGLLIPNVSQYTFVALTESWFAHGASVRIAERKFLDLNRERSDLKVKLVSRTEMISRDGRFDKNSAFGYIIYQLSHVLKDFNSSALSCESLKLILAEMEWREIYGTTPYDAFSNIVAHIAESGETSDWYTEPSLPTLGEETTTVKENLSSAKSDHFWAEQHYYANIDPIDSDGKVICTFVEPPDQHRLSNPVVMIRCHECHQRFESFDFSFHIASHVELNRHESERAEYKKRNLVECKHCFKTFSKEQLLMHKTLLRSHLHMVKYGCRICCVLLEGRAEYLQHMRTSHFEHETPYRCPSCKFASSFQRDVYIHFQEEHRHSMIILCPICLRSFTVRNPEKMTEDTMAELSKIIYNHVAEHYVISKSLTCSNCCLCFLTKNQLKMHKILHHDPFEVRPADVRMDEFVITKEEEEHCVKVMQIELYSGNKHPNPALDDHSREMEYFKRKALKRKKRKMKRRKDKKAIIDKEKIDNESDETKDESASTKTSIDESSSEASRGDKNIELPQKNQNNLASRLGDSDNEERVEEEEDDDDEDDDDDDEDDDDEDFSDDSFATAYDEGTIFVRGESEVKRFLELGRADLNVTSHNIYSKKSALPTSSSDTNNNISKAKKDTCSSRKLIKYLSRMKRADDIIPNQSAILTPRGRPAKCCECFQFVTKDHFVAAIDCKDCKYTTHCPRASIVHNKTTHTSAH